MALCKLRWVSQWEACSESVMDTPQTHLSLDSDKWNRIDFASPWAKCPPIGHAPPSQNPILCGLLQLPLERGRVRTLLVVICNVAEEKQWVLGSTASHISLFYSTKLRQKQTFTLFLSLQQHMYFHVVVRWSTRRWNPSPPELKIIPKVNRL